MAAPDTVTLEAVYQVPRERQPHGEEASAYLATVELAMRLLNWLIEHQGPWTIEWLQPEERTEELDEATAATQQRYAIAVRITPAH